MKADGEQTKTAKKSRKKSALKSVVINKSAPKINQDEYQNEEKPLKGDEE